MFIFQESEKSEGIVTDCMKNKMCVKNIWLHYSHVLSLNFFL